MSAHGLRVLFGWLLPAGLVLSARRTPDLRGALSLRLLAFFVGGVWMSGALHAADIRVPDQSWQYRRAVEQASQEFFGLEASPARLAAQLHQESGWNAEARSPFAIGLAQFVPATARWLPSVCPEVGQFDPWDPWQSIRAASCYDRWHFERLPAASECDRWAFTLSAYNGGLGWLRRDIRLASTAGADPARWFGNVDAHSARADWAQRENRSYVERILLRYEPAYISAGWPGEAACP